AGHTPDFHDAGGQMTSAGTATAPQPRRIGRSVAAVVTGLLCVAILSLVTDELLHVLNVYPPWGQPMYGAGLNLLTLSYRSAYTVIGAYITAQMAPRNPMRHVWILAGIGLAAAIGGVIAALSMPNLGPAWYPIALALTAVPLTWLGGFIHHKKHTA